MGTATLALLLATAPSGLAVQPRLPPADEVAGSLWPTQAGQPAPHAYTPREGDLVFFTDRSWMYGVLYPLARSFHPYHIGIVVRRVTGELVVLEAGSIDAWEVTLKPVRSRLLEQFGLDRPSRVWVRQLKCELTVEQSRDLTAFAEGQLGKPFSKRRRLLWLTIPGRPFPPRPTADQRDWSCSEIVAQAVVSAGILPAAAIRPQAVTPSDMLRDRRVDLGRYWSGIFVVSPDFAPPPPGPRLARP